MKILAIRGKNLASLAGDFGVDFSEEPLASAGLFAISGPTGAGKSTLLDALCLALYDETPRVARVGGRGTGLPDVGSETVGAHDPRTLLRRGTAEGHAEVDFVGNDGIGYRARWSVRRARARANGKLQDTQMTLQRLADAQPVAGALKSEVKSAIIERIGLSFEQFTRAVLLAQNEFFAFLKAGDDERAALLQTLTGTDRFESLSRRAFERNKIEQERLRALTDSVAAQQPLDADMRAHWERERQSRHAAEAAIEARGKALEAQLRWHAERAQAAAAQAEAQARCAAALARRENALARRRQLGAVESAQSARPLMADADRLATETAAQRKRAAAAEEAATAAMRRVAQARTNEQQGVASLGDATLAKAALAPAIAEARSLDATMAALAPEHERARRARDDAAAALSAAQLKVRDQQAAHRQAVDAQAHARQWLATHDHLQALGALWPRWDTLFSQAGGLLVRAAQAAGQASAFETELARAANEQATAQARLDSQAQSLATAQAAHAELVARLAQLDRDAVAEGKQQAELRRDRLQAALVQWRELTAARTQRESLGVERASRQQQIEACGQRLDAVLARQPAALAAQQQAERSWRLAYAACQDSVEALRAGLEPGMPCAVCGAADHPYVSAPPAMHDALAALEAEYRGRQAEVAELGAIESAQRSLVASHTEALDALTSKVEAAQRQLAECQRQWRDDPLVAELEPVPDAQRMDWLTESIEAAIRAQQTAAQSEARLRDLDRQCAAAASAVDTARNARHQHADALQIASGRAAELVLRQKAAAEAHAGLEAELATVLGELAEAGLAASSGPAWQDAWRADADAYRDARRADAATWQQRRAELEALGQRIVNLEAAVTGAVEAAESAAAQQRQTAADFAAADAGMQERLARRAALFAATVHANQPVAAIEVALDSAVQAAGKAMELARTEHQQALHEQARLDASRDQAWRLVATLDAEAAAASARVTAWLSHFNLAQIEGTVPIDVDALRTLLARDAAWLAQEREALQALERDVETARAIAEERRRKHELIDAARLTDEPAQAVQASLAALHAELDLAKRATAEAVFELRRDDERRTAAAGLMQQIEAQAEQARVWQSMNELIGAADGKKFRNFAQQLTLDILLGYANRHLAQLSRRYRLERVKQSLALLVVDQDMADEVRSVHSLSGGESFLVSLALALGLASLSSHRVRVESLFIDEGFGSLDAETLRVAMDALDSLQSQGRKVGVISHVQEMTERIGTRIEIRRMSGGQSRLVVDGVRG